MDRPRSCELVDRVRVETGIALDPRLPVIGFARRMTEYKRPELLFTDLERLTAIAARQPFNLVLGARLIRTTNRAGGRSRASINMHARWQAGSRSRICRTMGWRRRLAARVGSDLW